MSSCCGKLTGWVRSEKPLRILYIFDFDKTLVLENSEEIYKEFLSKESTRQILSNESCLNDWTPMCRAILEQLKYQGVKVKEILARIRLIEFAPGMDTLLQKVFISTIQNGKNELVILSGSNDLLISTLLASLTPPVYPNLVIANHLYFSDEENYLVFEPFKPQVGCPFCPPTLCKGEAMDSYIKEHGPFDLVYYTGDGGNDVCAAVRLRKQDVLFVKAGFALASAIKAGIYNRNRITVKAKIIYFSDARNIEKHMKIFNQKSPRC